MQICAKSLYRAKQKGFFRSVEAKFGTDKPRPNKFIEITGEDKRKPTKE
jgi:hypothetical protein